MRIVDSQANPVNRILRANVHLTLQHFSFTSLQAEADALKRQIATLILLVIWTPLSWAQTPRKPSYQELFEAVWQTINDNFFDPSFGGVDWKGLRQRYQAEVGKIKDDSSFTELAYRMMREL